MKKRTIVLAISLLFVLCLFTTTSLAFGNETATNTKVLHIGQEYTISWSDWSPSRPYAWSSDKTIVSVANDSKETKYINHSPYYCWSVITKCKGMAIGNATVKAGPYTIDFIVEEHTPGSPVQSKAPTYFEDGVMTTYCSGCGEVLYTSRIPALGLIGDKYSIDFMEISLLPSSYYYTGTYIMPAVIVKKGDIDLVEGKDFVVSYFDNKEVGTGKVIITGIGDYTGESIKTFTINPSKVTLRRLTKVSSGKFKITWEPIPQSTGFQICYSTSRTFDTSKSVLVKGENATTKTISKLKKGKKYYVKVRSYKTMNGVKYYGTWSATKPIRV